ncbi:aldehyde dehydrogenase [Bordetella sp. FB-8]|uniref:aldehyde dehydrogenase family protein n=1 Tax=Bordetella sp. FB-8 TaxID=1159870 RepID=UPI00037D246C|nr:aldehyde dehydrogenase family protein [Bordetella sp. FB-8]
MLYDFTLPRLSTPWSSCDDSLNFTVENPATRQLLGTVRGGGPTQVDAAVKAAQRGFATWSRRPARERGRCLLAAATLLRDHADDLARLESAENGKPVSVARDFDIEMCIASFEYFGALIGSLPQESHDLGPLLSQAFLEPYGVIAGIIPFNWPPIHFGAKVAPALAVGNAIVLKPGEQAPLTVMRLAEIVQQAMPDDILHVVPGLGQTGAALVSHPGVRKISFTGAPTTGKKVGAAAAENLTPTLMELGGKNPLIVFEDADLDLAAQDIIEGAFFNNGSACTAASRILVQRSVHAPLVARVAAAVAKLRVGNGADPSTHVGPMVTPEHQRRVLDYIALGKQEGAVIAAQAPRPQDPLVEDGCFVLPTLFVDVTPGMRIAREEIFGPVTCVIAFDTEVDAVRIANDTDFALVAGVYSRDSERALRVARDLEAGIVFVNNYNRSVLGTAFGGTKASGHGREHCIDTLKEFGYSKVVRMPSGRGQVARWWAAAETMSR